MYIEVWQCGRFVKPPETAEAVSDDRVDDFRQRVQRARIDKRLAIPALAALVECDASCLAAFEAGRGVIPDACRSRLISVLKL
jgi:ribosome-binding protein aMBF1 (putative translation factor)